MQSKASSQPIGCKNPQIPTFNSLSLRLIKQQSTISEVISRSTRPLCASILFTAYVLRRASFSLSTSRRVEWKVEVESLAGVGPLGGSYGRDIGVLAGGVQMHTWNTACARVKRL